MCVENGGVTGAHSEGSKHKISASLLQLMLLLIFRFFFSSSLEYVGGGVLTQQNSEYLSPVLVFWRMTVNRHLRR